MNQFKLITGGITAGILFLMACNSAFAENAPETTTNSPGEIILSEVETYGVDPEWCHIPAIVGKYRLNEMRNCYTDDYDLIRFNNVDSGLTVTIFGYNECASDYYNNWAFAVTTVKQPTTTPGSGGQAIGDWISFQSIWTTEPTGKIVSPGVMKQGRWKAGDPNTIPKLTNQASCVLIERL